MADKRMLSKKITDHDNFTSLPASAQALYMHLCLSADDDGFCNQVNVAIYKAHAKKKDLETLIDRKYILRFDKNVVCIKHWLMMNAIRKDRYQPTVYQTELHGLHVRADKAYTMATTRQPNGNQCLPQDRIGKVSIGKNSIDREDMNNSNSIKATTDPAQSIYDDDDIPGLEVY